MNDQPWALSLDAQQWASAAVVTMYPVFGSWSLLFWRDQITANGLYAKINIEANVRALEFNVATPPAEWR